MAERRLVVITDHVFPNLNPERSLLEALGVELRSGQARRVEEVVHVARGAHALLVCYAPVTAEVIRRLDRCKVIVRYGVGVDNVDLMAATAAGIPVATVPDYCIDEVSDHALALLLALARKVASADRLVRSGAWMLEPLLPIHRLRGQTLGLVGLGRIARAVARKAMAFGLDVISHDPYVSSSAAEETGVRLVDFETLLASSDYVSIHVALTEETRGLFNEGSLRKMKPGAFLINTSRGPVVEEEALSRALRKGWIAGAALDVVTVEPPPEDWHLKGLDNLILTPHMAFYSEESLVDLQTQAAQEVARVLNGGMPLNLANKEVLSKGARRDE